MGAVAAALTLKRHPSQWLPTSNPQNAHFYIHIISIELSWGIRTLNEEKHRLVMEGHPVRRQGKKPCYAQTHLPTGGTKRSLVLGCTPSRALGISSTYNFSTLGSNILELGYQGTNEVFRRAEVSVKASPPIREQHWARGTGYTLSWASPDAEPQLGIQAEDLGILVASSCTDQWQVTLEATPDVLWFPPPSQSSWENPKTNMAWGIPWWSSG